MKNCGLSRLVIAASELDSAGEEITLARAIHAADVWQNRVEYPSLAEAARHFSLLAGTSRRRGKNRKGVSLTPRELAAFLAERGGDSGAGAAGDTVAIVFGNERTGLSDAELALCSVASHIPVAPEFPSMNLSHAVQIYAYELFLALSPLAKTEVKGAWKPVPLPEVETLAASVCGSLEKIGFYKQVTQERQRAFFRDLFSRAGVTQAEQEYIRGIFEKIAHLV
jgi:tRNA/rRNA methyltransferase/tRNA (cytidine32/uridine32-2'-O)-methyltransferase